MADPVKSAVRKEALKAFAKLNRKRVDHPLAKYNSLNQLVCVLCNNVIKNDSLWNAHIQSRTHKEKAIALKTQGPAKPSHLETTSAKRKADTISIKGVKKKKTDPASSVKSNSLPADFFDDEAKRKETKEKAKAAFLAGYSSSSGEESDEEEEEKSQIKSQPNSSSTNDAVKNGLPADFFDAGHEPSDSEETKTDKGEPSQSKKMSEVLPEGFFDDPKMDAKVRNVEYKDKMEEEWDLFQRAMKEESHVSEVIVEEEDEQVNLNRNIHEIDDQIQRWQEVENLSIKKENIPKTSKDDSDDNDEDDLNDDDLEQFLEWRAKKVMK